MTEHSMRVRFEFIKWTLVVLLWALITHWAIFLAIAEHVAYKGQTRAAGFYWNGRQIGDNGGWWRLWDSPYNTGGSADMRVTYADGTFREITEKDKYWYKRVRKVR